MKRKKKASMFFSPLMYVSFLIFLIFLLVIVNSKNRSVKNLRIGEEAFSILKIQQKAEKLRFYVQQSAYYAAKDSVNEFLRNGGFSEPKKTLGSSLWSVKKPDFDSELSKLFSKNLVKYLEKSPEFIPRDYAIVVSHDDTNVYFAGKALENIELLGGKPVFKGLIWPTGKFKGKYSVAVPYGPRIHPIRKTKNFHTGIDIDADSDEIYAVADGVVEDIFTQCPECYYRSETDKSDDSCFKCNVGYGNYIRIKHDGFETIYAHLREVKVDKGDTVKAGDVIGLMGSSGTSTSRHLHFEIRVDGKTIDPLCYYEGLDINAKGARCSTTKYSVNASFNTSIPLSLKDYEELKLVVDEIIKDCKNPLIIDKKDCVEKKLSATGFSYSFDCYSDFEKPFYTILQGIYDCSYSTDDDCVCSIGKDLFKDSLSDYSGNYKINFLEDNSNNQLKTYAFVSLESQDQLGKNDEKIDESIEHLGLVSVRNNNLELSNKNNIVLLLRYKDGVFNTLKLKIDNKATQVDKILIYKNGGLFFVKPTDYKYFENNYKKCNLNREVFNICVSKMRFSIDLS